MHTQVYAAVCVTPHCTAWLHNTYSGAPGIGALGTQADTCHTVHNDAGQTNGATQRTTQARTRTHAPDTMYEGLQRSTHTRAHTQRVQLPKPTHAFCEKWASGHLVISFRVSALEPVGDSNGSLPHTRVYSRTPRHHTSMALPGFINTHVVRNAPHTRTHIHKAWGGREQGLGSMS
jgi:hypothetical protein